MFVSGNQPTQPHLRDVQIWLRNLDARSEAEPHQVLLETSQAEPVLASWTSSDAYAWLMALRAKSFRLVDDLDGVCDAVDAILPQLSDSQVVVAHLELEKGMALTQFDQPRKAAACLKHAAEVFGRHGDTGGRAWALVSLAEAYCASGYPEDPYPMLQEALTSAKLTGEERVASRAWKQLAVVHRHRGATAKAFAAIQKALDGDITSHMRANFLLERGHLLAWSGRYGEADTDYEDALITYLEYGDELGQANTERALAYNALLLGRFTEGLKRLETAANCYRTARNYTGLGYVLREQSSTRFAQGDIDLAARDAELGLEAFRGSADSLGLAGMLNTTARMQQRRGHNDRAQELLAESLSLTADGTNPLARASSLSLQADLATDAYQRVKAADEAAQFFGRMGVWVGEAVAHASRAKALRDLNSSKDPMEAFTAAAQALRRARVEVIDPGRRADHDFALRDVTTTLMKVGAQVGGSAASTLCANLILDSAPLGLRTELTAGSPGSEVNDFISRVATLPCRSIMTPDGQRPLLQQLAATLGLIDPSRIPWFTFADMQSTHPDHALLLVGLPQHDRTLPVAWGLPGSESPCFSLVTMNEEAVGSLDCLGYAFDEGRSNPLWESSARTWQTGLRDILLPAALQRWVMQSGTRLAVFLPPLLAHVPIEALLVEEVPLGVRTAVARIPAPNGATPQPQGTLSAINSYLDPALPWVHEREALYATNAVLVSDAEQAPALLRTNTLTLIGCHGSVETRLDGALISTAGERVLDAIDILRQPLTDSILVFESCYSGRYMGERTGEQLTLATAALVAGATAAVGGLFSLPAQDETTGVLIAALIERIAQGDDVPEALRYARQTYWNDRPKQVRRPGMEAAFMTSDAPWAWAGLVAFTR